MPIFKEYMGNFPRKKNTFARKIQKFQMIFAGSYFQTRKCPDWVDWIQWQRPRGELGLVWWESLWVNLKHFPHKLQLHWTHCCCGCCVKNSQFSVAATYVNWKVGNPNAGTGANCAVMNPSGTWDDVMCGSGDRKFPFVCEKGTNADIHCHCQPVWCLTCTKLEAFLNASCLRQVE